MLKLSWEWLDAPHVPVRSHALTWARFEVRVGSICATHVEDLRTTSVRDAIYIPLLPLAEWIAAHWWFLFSEAASDIDMKAAREAPSPRRRWYSRHNLLFAREGDPLPDLSISLADDDLALVQMASDPTQPNRRYPVRFTERAIARVPLRELREQLSTFMDSVVERLQDCVETDSVELKDRWLTLRTMTGEDRLLRQRAASLGLDGDDPDEVSDELANELVHGLATLPCGLASDLLTGSADLENVRARAAKVNAARAMLVPDGAARQLDQARATVMPLIDPFAPPHRIGWDMAKKFRENVLASGPDCTGGLLDRALEKSDTTRFFKKADFNDEFVRGWVSANAHGIASAVLPPVQKSTQRFLQARAVALALLGRRERLITNAATQPQAISRAFATELLAPADAVSDLLRGRTATSDVTYEIASRLDVGPQVIIHQIENHGMASVAD